MVTIINNGIIVSSDQIPANVAKKASVAQLSALKTFADSSGLLIAHSGVNVGLFTRDITLAAGTQAITGLGFKPSAIMFLTALFNRSEMSIGLDDGITATSIDDNIAYTVDTYSSGSPYSIYIGSSPTAYYLGKIQSFDVDGFTIVWAKAGAPTGTFSVSFLAFR